MALERVLGGWWSTANPSLKGHQLLIVSPTAPAPEWVSKIKKAHRDLDVQHIDINPWSLDAAAAARTRDIDWSKATVLLTGPLVPTIEQAPRLELVQLQSAGANYLLDNPLFKDSDVAFSTANGVHGSVASLFIVFARQLHCYECGLLASSASFANIIRQPPNCRMGDYHLSDAPTRM